MRSYEFLPEQYARELAEELKGCEWEAKQSQIDSVRSKNNLELTDHPALDEFKERLETSEVILKEHYVRHVMRPMFSRYTEGMAYNTHNDAPIMGPMRTDLACTIFLNDDYEGGELCIEGMGYKGAPGVAVVYECWRPHYVNPVLEGERICAVTWMQSMVRDPQRREMLGMMKRSLEDIEAGGNSHYVTLSSVYGKLMRMWID